MHELGDVLQVLEGHAVHLVSESAEDLNLSFVVDQPSADEIVEKMHKKFFPMVVCAEGKTSLQQGGDAAASKLNGHENGNGTAGTSTANRPTTLPLKMKTHANIHHSDSREKLLGSTWSELGSPPTETS